MIVSAVLLTALIAFVVAINLAARREDSRRKTLPPEEQARLKAEHDSDMQTFSF
jgi:hypothetical protein